MACWRKGREQRKCRGAAVWDTDACSSGGSDEGFVFPVKQPRFLVIQSFSLKPSGIGVVGLIFDDWLVCAEIPHGQQLVEGVNKVRPFFYDRMYFVIPPLVAKPSGQTLIEFGLDV